ncbi:FtsW/RodA/SpoVE family cell cycle protein [Marinisporobacter balticus]|uniref:Cell cycle protein n=1 Tax=Marinisporobacter balticus TaxID=2018667 RepID=A0A4R2L6C0_9FIRM|nr:FtsW/RodA/SpoVE family cell cycle protein [Marinisporobacter balticus]TCO74755.1 cell cycle protein [Marinisporobacter balticus]
MSVIKSQINDYLSQVCSYIKYKEAHEEIKLELNSHIQDIADEYIEDGFSQDEGIKNAIHRMGIAEEVGKKLHLAHKGTPEENKSTIKLDKHTSTININKKSISILLMAFFLLSLIATYFLRMFHITKNIHDPYGKLLVNGLMSILAIEFILNILMNMNCIPLVGISLPFMSYGGTLCVFHTLSIGLILSVYRRRSLSVINS